MEIVIDGFYIETQIIDTTVYVYISRGNCRSNLSSVEVSGVIESDNHEIITVPWYIVEYAQDLENMTYDAFF
jgi:hypothetical protein